MKCRFFRFTMSRALDDRRPLSARTERHLAGCASCREHHQAQLLLIRDFQTGGKIEGLAASCASRLRTGTAAEAAHPVPRATGPSQFLRSRILNEITNSPHRESPAALARWFWAFGIAAVIVLAAIISQSQRRPTLDLVAEDQPTPNAAAALMVATVRFANGGQLLQAASDLDQPLQTEMNLVISDARAVLRSLQTDFVPSQLLASSE